ncbi:MAG: hypothetical protein GY801_02440 [bacterium]|nr:hypothetical protein [bacterium]
MKIIKFFLVVCLLLLSIGYMEEILEMVLTVKEVPPSIKLFGYGGLAFLLFRLLFRKRMHAFSVFEHELTHVLVAKLFFLKTLHFSVSPRKHVEGQVVVGVEGRGPLTGVMSVFFSLAPYYLPTLTLAAFAFYPFLGERMAALFFFMMGFTAIYHLATTVQEFGFHQADIQKHGEYFSTVFILLGNIIFLGIVLSFMLNEGFEETPGFLVQGILNVFG